MSRTRDLGKVVSGNVNLPSAAVDSDFTVDTSTLVVDATNNRVGVGTASPSTKLTVASASYQDHILLDRTGVGSMHITATNPRGVSITDGTADYFTLLQSNGQVGIGTNNPVEKLHVKDNTGSVIRVEGPASGDIPSGVYLYNDTTLESSWYVNPTHDTTFLSRNQFNIRTNNAERMRIDNAGRVTMPYQPVFRARLGSVINNPSGQVITFTVSQLDTGNNYSTSNSRFTAPVAGKYFFGVRFYASIRSGGLRVLHNHWRINGGNALDSTMGGGTGGDGGYSAHPTLTDTCILYLSAGDYVEFYNSSRSSTGNFDLEDGYFYGHLIG